jgi:hypothetical protein
LLGESNLKELWQAACLYDGSLLKEVCIKYAKKNPLSVLANSEFINLKFEDPTSWQEFANSIAPK